MNKKDILKWTQTKGRLQDKKGYCCLGVACDLFIPKDLQIIDSFGRLKFDIPRWQTYAPNWLKEINHDFGDKFEINDENAPLIVLNDCLDYNFDEIADLLELVYVHSALK